MSEYLNFVDELLLADAEDFVLGSYLYLGQVKTVEGKSIVVSVGYKPNYALRKMQENFAALQAGATISECYLRKIRVGETDDCGKIALPLEMLGQ